MAVSATHHDSYNWKSIAIGLIAFIVTAVLVGGVVAYRNDNTSETARPAAKAPPQKVAAAQSAPAAEPRRPSASDIQQCNAEAKDAEHSTGDTVKSAVIGGAAGAGVGAAGGAIADGGRGAGKGAGIGAIVGAAAGTLYGLNESNKNSERSADAYRTCMARRGF